MYDTDFVNYIKRRLRSKCPSDALQKLPFDAMSNYFILELADAFIEASNQLHSIREIVDKKDEQE